jgi:hypothetical protein
MTIQVNGGNHLKLTYSGYGKYTVTWAGWPSEGHKSVRRTLHDDKLSGAAAQAAGLFAAWLETGPMGDKHKCDVVRVTAATTSNPDVSAVIVETNWVD